MLFTEKRDLLTSDMDWGYEVTPFEHKMHTCMTPEQSKKQFLLQYKYLGHKLHQETNEN